MPSIKELQEIAAKARAAKLAKEAAGVMPAVASVPKDVAPGVYDAKLVDNKVEVITKVSEQTLPVKAAELPAVEPINDQHRKILESLGTLQQMLIDADPEFPGLLQEIHDNLFQYPELTHILTDEQIGVVYQALMKESNTHIIVSASKKQSAGKVKKELTGLLSDGGNVGDLL